MSCLQVPANDPDGARDVGQVVLDGSILAIDGHDGRDGRGGRLDEFPPDVSEVTVFASGPFRGASIFDIEASLQRVAVRHLNRAISCGFAGLSDGRRLSLTGQ